MSAWLLGTAPAAAAGGVKTGVLTCDISSGWGLVLASARSADCVYRPASGNPERYTGTVGKLGADIGYVASATMIWAVFAPSADVGPTGLEGAYVGATAAASLGYGGGVNVLLGGGKSIALQPISVDGMTGFDIAAGVGTLTLSAKK